MTLYCIPWALHKITGAPPTVINQALLRYSPKWTIACDGIATFAKPQAAVAALIDLGCRVYRPRFAFDAVYNWAEYSAERSSLLLLFTLSHAVVADSGYIFDNQTPEGVPYYGHPDFSSSVEDAFIVRH